MLSSVEHEKSFITSGPNLVENHARQVLLILYLLSPSPASPKFICFFHLSSKFILKCRLPKSYAASHTNYRQTVCTLIRLLIEDKSGLSTDCLLKRRLKNSRRHTAGDI